jgi:hypothetical protein
MIGEFTVVLHSIWHVFGGNGGVYFGSTALHGGWSYSTKFKIGRGKSYQSDR